MDPINPIAAKQQIPSAVDMTEGTLRGSLNKLDQHGKAEQMAHQLESTFLSMMLSAMRETVPDGGVFGKDPAQKTFQGMLDQEYVQQASTHWKMDFHDTLVRQILDPHGTLGRGAGGANAESLKAISPVKPEAALDLPDVASLFRKGG